LSLAGIDNLVIMRVHYAWKEWMARHQLGTFSWSQAWQQLPTAHAPLCLNFPYDIYSIKHSCGPSPQTCLGYDFRHLGKCAV
jgi:alpha-mannosidase